MELKHQWCDQIECRDFGKVDAGNIKVYSHVERRFYCTTCWHSFSADHGTFFETLRSERDQVLEVLALLGERNSLRGLERTKHYPANTILHWLDLAGQHLQTLSDTLIRSVRLNQAQIDELWTFVKKTRTSATQRPDGIWRHMDLACSGFAEPPPCGDIC
jgi:transposase-like protein